METPEAPNGSTITSETHDDSSSLTDKPLDVSVIVVSYNTIDLTLDCIRSVFDQTHDISFEVLVIDNCSSDGSSAAIRNKFPAARLIESEENVGFAQANNIAAEKSSAKYLLLLNPDTVILDGAIQKLYQFAEQYPRAGIYGGRTLFGDGSLNSSSCWAKPSIWSMVCYGIGLSSIFRNNRFFDPETYGSWKRDTVRKVDIVTGCFFLIQRDLWRQLKGFDRAFFMYAEEADLCLRARSLGAQPMICPEATIVHYGGASERVRADKMIRLFRARIQLIRKHWHGFLAPLGVAMMISWALSRMCAFAVLRIVSKSARHSFDTWHTVWQKRRSWQTADGEHYKPAVDSANQG